MAHYWSFKKQSYRPRYCGNRFQDVPDLKPGDAAVSFVTKYFNVTTSTSDVDSTVNRTSSPVQVTSHQSREEEAQDAPTSCVNDPPGQLKDVQLKKTANDPSKNTSRSEMCENPEFSDEESDFGQHDTIAKLIEESFIENNDLLGNSKKCVEKLYTSNTSVLQEPPSPTSKIHAKKCLSFRDVTAVARKSENTDMALRRLLHNTEQETLNLNNENPKPTNTTSDMRPKATFVTGQERGSRLSGWFSPFKKTTVLSSSTPVQAKRTPTPMFQEKTNLIKSTSLPQKKSENNKSSAGTTVNSERMSNDPNSRRIGFLDAFLKSSAFGYVGNRSPAVSEPPPISFTAITDEEFDLEGMSSKNKSFHLTLPVKAKPTQHGYVNTGEKTTLQITNSKSKQKKRSEKKETRSPKEAVTQSVQEVAPSGTGEGVEPGTETKDAETQQVLEQIEKPMASSQDADIPHNVEEEEDGFQDMLPVENPDGNDSQHAEKTRSPMLQKQTEHSLRRKGNKRIVSVFKDLDTTFNILSRKGKGKAKSTKPAKKAKKSKSSGKKLEHQVRKKKTKNNVVKNKHLYSQSQNGRLKIDDRDKQAAETEEDLLPRKRKAKIKHISTPCHAEHSNEESVFQSGPVIRQRALRSTAAIKPVACDLDSLESVDQEKHGSFEVDNDAATFCSEKHKELLARCSIVFDPETRSDVLVDCVSQGEKSEFFGGDACTSWNSFNNRLFNTGKLIIAPKKFTTMRISMSVMIFYIEQGQVRLNLHKSEWILKAGDFFFVPPANRSKITNLQDKEAVLIFNRLNAFSKFTEG
ncbi:centromere protein C isoform X3 [Ranitomeya imitator]|uniref:centromere protein C isoform X3 n=1 Tax=Ranitomeya imitator TaxID=111125 RepID=UPI0037E8D000